MRKPPSPGGIVRVRVGNAGWRSTKPHSRHQQIMEEQPPVEQEAQPKPSAKPKEKPKPKEKLKETPKKTLTETPVKPLMEELVEPETVEAPPNSPDSPSLNEGLEQAIQLHDRGVKGDKNAVVQAIELLEKLHRENPEDLLTAGYLGSATCLLGRDVVDPNLRFTKALEGLRILDRVMKEAPDLIPVRSLRGHVSDRLPEMFFHRTETAIQDFSYLASRFEEGEQSITPEYYWEILYLLGHAQKRLERDSAAKKTWQKLLSATDNPKYAKLLRAEGLGAAVDEGHEAEEREEKKNSPKRDLSAIQEGLTLYERALSGDKQATQAAHEYFNNIHNENPEDFFIKAHLADCHSMQGRDANDPGEMFASAIRAMKSLDSCVAAEPDDIQIRMIRAYHSFRIPEAFFRRTATAMNDFEFLCQQYEQGHADLSLETYWQLLFDLGLCYKRLGFVDEAETTWNKLLSQNPDPAFEKSINEQRMRDQPIDLGHLKRLRGKDELLEEGMRMHALGVAGNRQATEAAHELLKQAHELDPDDPLAMGYYGSSIALLGRDATDPGVVFSNIFKGLKWLKQAIGKDWQNPQIRILRAYLFYSLPEAFFHLTEKAIKDFRSVKSAYERDNRLLPKETYWQVLFDLGVAYQRIGEPDKAERVWSELCDEDVDPKYRELIQQQKTGE